MSVVLWLRCLLGFVGYIKLTDYCGMILRNIRRYIALAFIPLSGTLLATKGHAQSLWEVTPYEARVWIAFGTQPDIPATWREDLPVRVEARVESLFRAVWSGEVTPAPAPIEPAILNDLDQLDAERLLEWGKFPKLPTQRGQPSDRQVGKPAPQTDKLILVALDSVEGRYRIRARQLDCQTRTWSETSTNYTPLPASLVETIAQAIVEGFSPVALIDRVDGENASLKLRAGALIRRPFSPALLHEGSVLNPVVRRSDRTGRPAPDGIQPVPWTYLAVTNEDPAQLQCRLVTGFRQPFSARRNRRVQRLAVLVRSENTETTLRLQSRDDPNTPLVGYEVYLRQDESSDSKLLGTSDWRGQVRILPTDQAIQLLYVRHGKRLLAKLPLVPGLQPEVVAALRDDRTQLEAEGFLEGIQAQLVEMVARRESLAYRIRKRIETRDFAAAEQLLGQFRALPSQDDLRRQIEQRQQTMAPADEQLRRKIDTLFAETYRTVGKYLNPRRAQELQAELRQAQQAAVD